MDNITSNVVNFFRVSVARNRYPNSFILRLVRRERLGPKTAEHPVEHEGCDRLTEDRTPEELTSIEEHAKESVQQTTVHDFCHAQHVSQSSSGRMCMT